MKFVIESVSKCSARLGLITNLERLPDKAFKTPMVLYTNPQLSQEVLELSGFDVTKDFGVCLPVFNVEHMERPVQLLKKSLSEFVGLKDCLTFISLKSGSEFNPSGSHEKGSIPIFKKAGRINITPERYMNMMETFQPDFYTTLADSDTFLNCPKKRTTKSCERTEEMFEECLKRKKTSSLLQSSSMIACIEGGFNEFERKRMVEQLKDHKDDISGYFIDGLHRNGHEATTLSMSSIKEIVQQTLSMLPENKMKMMLGAYLPHVTLELIGSGVDVFDTSLPTLATNSNRALVFNFDINNPSRSNPPEIDLMDSKFKDEFSPFVENCQCIACRNHTRAYLNHLVLTHELLGTTLLTIHNLYHYRRFFDAIREAIKNEKLSDLIELVAAQYNDAQNLVYEVVEDKPTKNKDKSC